jgi:hypothetical protein
MPNSHCTGINLAHAQSKELECATEIQHIAPVFEAQEYIEWDGHRVHVSARRKRAFNEFWRRILTP